MVLDKVVQFVGDNLDIAIRSQYGNNAFHAMGRIKITSPEPPEILDPIITRQNFQTGEKATLLQLLETKMRPYNPVKSNGLSKVVFRPFEELQQKGRSMCTTRLV